MTTAEDVKKLIATGEGITLEFKRCQGEIERDTYETVCSFSNRFGGDILLGVDDDGIICGIPPNAVKQRIQNFIGQVCNPVNFNPPLFIIPERVDVDGKTVICIHVPDGGDVCRFRGEFYDRVNDSDVVLRSKDQVFPLFVRKRVYVTERQVYPELDSSALKMELMPHVRQLAVNNTPGHPWKDMSDEDILKSAQFWGYDKDTAKIGLNAAALLCLGRPEVIRAYFPWHKTECLVLKYNVERCDDREIIFDNLFESYNKILEFGHKWLPDKFYIENDMRKSLRGWIVRELASNILIHREFSSKYQSRFVIEKERMFIENPNVPNYQGVVDFHLMRPSPKNPIIANFFRNVGYADELGSGARHLLRYVPLYSGGFPTFEDGDFYKIVVPLKETHIPNENMSAGQDGGTGMLGDKLGDKLGDNQRKIFRLVEEDPNITIPALSKKIGISTTAIENNLAKLQAKKIIKRVGPDHGGHWEVLK